MLNCHALMTPSWTYMPRLSLWSYINHNRCTKGYQMGEAVRAGEISVEPPPCDDSRKRSRYNLKSWEAQGKSERHALADEAESCGGASMDILLRSNFILDDIGPVSMVLSSDFLTWNGLEDQVDNGLMWCCGLLGGSDLSNKLKITDIYSVETYETGNVHQDGVHNAVAYGHLAPNKVHHLLVVHSYKKVHKHKWVPRAYVFQHADIGVCRRWAYQIQALIDGDTNRPKNLLVVVNPHSGKKTAWKTWQEVSCLFKRAKVDTMVLKTERVRHAFDVMNSFSDQDLTTLDGVVVVGGDGLFNEVLNGLLLRHHNARLPRRPDGLNRTFNSSESQKMNLMENTRDQILSTDTREPSNNKDLAALQNSDDLHPFLESLATKDTRSRSFEKSSVRSLLSELQSHEDKPPDVAEMTFPSSSSNGRDHNFHTADVMNGGFVIQDFPDGNSNSNGTNGDIGGGFAADGVFVFPNQKFRLGIIPAGSTDSVAVSTTGSRDPATSALRIIFGEKMPLDIVRLVSWKSASTTLAGEPPRVRYAASFAGYGFYGDVIKESEPSRWMGPLRYDYAGTKVFLQHKTYEAEVSYVELPETMSNALSVSSHSFDESSSHRKMQKRELSRMVCRANCGICAKGCDYSDIGEKSDQFLSLQKGPRWKHVKGSFISIGAAVISCRNDKAPNGIAASAHLADGLLHLILVKGCSRLAYLWHLIRLTREDADPLDFGFVEEYKTPCFNFVSKGEESIWNVDGELFPAQQLSAQVFRGLVNIFASGPDL